MNTLCKLLETPHYLWLSAPGDDKNKASAVVPFKLYNYLGKNCRYSILIKHMKTFFKALEKSDDLNLEHKNVTCDRNNKECVTSNKDNLSKW